jgi:hypothetical protein
MYLVRVYRIGVLAEKTNSIIMTKRRRISFLTMLALFSSFVLLAPSLLSLLPSLLQGATAQLPPEECNKCLVIEYEGEHTTVISGVESFANMTTRQEQYNSYLWKFVNSLVSDGFEIKAMMVDDTRCEDDDGTERIYQVVLEMP